MDGHCFDRNIGRGQCYSSVALNRHVVTISFRKVMSERFSLDLGDKSTVPIHTTSHTMAALYPCVKLCHCRRNVCIFSIPDSIGESYNSTNDCLSVRTAKTLTFLV